MSIFGDVSLALNTVSSTVSSFESFVNDKVSTVKDVVSDVQSLSNNVQSLVSTLDPKNKIAFTKELYDKAISLAEIDSIALKYVEDTSKNKYGLFKGGNVYKSFNGELDTSNANVPSYYGWLTIDKSSAEYCLFSNDAVSFIIALKDFEPKPIVADFTPLYIKLQEENRGNNYYYNDLGVTGALATTFKDKVAESVVNDSFDVNLAEINEPIKTTIFKAMQENLSLDRIKSYLLQIKSNAKYNDRYKEYTKQRDSILKNILETEVNTDNITLSDSFSRTQAIIYTLPYNDTSSTTDKDAANQFLLCYQQPDSISYTSSASYESVSPRGSQQPFQFYTSANAMELSFTLKYHYDEIQGNNKTQDGSNSSRYDTLKYNSLQEIASIAESFTRPWSKANKSIAPKIVKVILPGITHIGYMSSAQINYKGDMMGDAFSYNSTSGRSIDKLTVSNDYVGDLLSDKSDNNSPSYHTYFYNQLEISFNLIIIKDIVLDVANEPKKSEDNNKNNSSDNSNESVKDKQAPKEIEDANQQSIADNFSRNVSSAEQDQAQSNMSSLSEAVSNILSGDIITESTVADTIANSKLVKLVKSSIQSSGSVSGSSH